MFPVGRVHIINSELMFEYELRGNLIVRIQILQSKSENEDHKRAVI